MAKYVINGLPKTTYCTINIELSKNKYKISSKMNDAFLRYINVTLLSLIAEVERRSSNVKVKVLFLAE